MNELQAEFERIADGFALALSAGPYVACRLSRAEQSVGRFKTFDAGVNAGLDVEIRRFVIGIEAEYVLTRACRRLSISCTI